MSDLLSQRLSRKRLFAAALLLMALATALWLAPVLRVQRQVAALGGVVVFDTSVVGGIPTDGPRVFGPSSSWWEQLRILRTGVRMVYLTGPQVNDDNFPNLSALGPISELELGQSSIGTHTLEKIALMPGLKTLRISATNVGDVEMNYLFNIKELEALDLDRTDVSDANVIRLAEIHTLKFIACRHTRVTQSGAGEAMLRNPGLRVVFKNL